MKLSFIHYSFTGTCVSSGDALLDLRLSLRRGAEGYRRNGGPLQWLLRLKCEAATCSRSRFPAFPACSCCAPAAAHRALPSACPSGLCLILLKEAESLLGRAWRDELEGPLHVALGDGRDTVGLLNGGERGLSSERSQLSARVALRACGDAREVDVVCEWHAPRVDAQHLQAARLVRQADVYERVEAAGAEERGVDEVGSVGGGNDQHGRERLHTVHFVEQLSEDARADAAATALASGSPLGSERVDFVKEDDGGRRSTRAAEESGDSTLALANPL